MGSDSSMVSRFGGVARAGAKIPTGVARRGRLRCYRLMFASLDKPMDGPALARRELAAAGAAGAMFFCVLSSYFVLRPLRETFGIAGGVGELTWLFQATLLATLAIQPVISWLVGRYERTRFIPLIYRCLTLVLLLFAAVLALAGRDAARLTGYVFYVWLSVYNVLTVSLFWAFLADSFGYERSRGWFARIGVGGTLGAIAGAAAAERLPALVPEYGFLIVAAALLELAVLAFAWCERRVRVLPAALVRAPARPMVAGAVADDDRRPAAEDTLSVALHGLRLALRSPFLLAICAFVGLVSISSTFLYFAQARIISASTMERAARTALFAQFDLWTQILTLIAQLTLTAAIIRRVGVGAALALLPALSVLGLVALAASPTIVALALVQAMHRAARHAIVGPARETLFTVVSRDEKYKAKCLIDTFVFRAGDMVGALADRALTALGPVLGLIGTAFVLAPVGAIWIGLSLWLGLAQRRRAVDPWPASKQIPSNPSIGEAHAVPT